MHELSIAQNIIDTIKNSVERNKLNLVERVSLRIGKLSNILIDSLEFCFYSAVENTSLHNCKLSIENVPIKIKCNDCNEINTTNDFVFTCPVCNSSSISVIGGDELIISSIHLKDESEYTK